MSAIRKVGVKSLLSDSITTATGSQIEPWHTNRTFETYGTTSTGSGSATIVIEVRNSENSPWHTLATSTLTLGTAVTGDGMVSSAAWRYVRARVSAISGTDATVSANMGSAPL